MFKARGKMGALVSLYLLNVVPSDRDCIGYSSHWCGKLSDSSLRKKGLGLGLQFTENTVHRRGEGMVAGTGGSWSHHIGSQEAERVNRGENQAIKLQDPLSSFTSKGSITFHRDYLTQGDGRHCILRP